MVDRVHQRPANDGMVVGDENLEASGGQAR
jgi:hypothetical protein